MAKKVEFDQSGLGDVSSLLHNRGLSDLSWLDLDPDDYHRAEALPKQNLDVIPELQRALEFDGDSRVPSLIPLRPHTIVNTNPLDPPGAPERDVSPQISNRVAKYLISGMRPKDLEERISLEFSPIQIGMAKSHISSLMDERGLVGNIYVDAKHFPRCAQNSDDKKFVATKARQAKFVVAKSECGGCIHNHDGMCANLHKQLVESVPYDRRTFATYAVQLAQEGRLVQGELSSAISGSDSDRRKVLQASFCSSPAEFKQDSGPQVRLRQQDKQVKRVYSDQEISEYLSREVVVEKVLSPRAAAASRHIMLGGHPDVLLASQDPEVRQVASMHGILGHTYLDMDALGGCSKTLSFISRMQSPPDFVVRRTACCGECKGMSDGACRQIESIAPIVNDEEVTKDHFVAALLRAVDRRAITIDQARTAAEKVKPRSNWRKLTAQANLMQEKVQTAAYLCSTVRAHHGASVPQKEMVKTARVDAEEVRRTVSHLMNTGKSGRYLQAAILQKYAREDLRRVPRVGQELSKHDGIQGIYFIDPTAYPDYGRGCQVGSKQFRKRGAENLMIGEACLGCTLQTAPGWCSKYAKNLVNHVPESVVKEYREARACEIETAPLKNPVEEFGLQQDGMTVDIEKKAGASDMSLPTRSVAG